MDDDNNSLELKKQINMTFGAGYKKSDLADQVIHEEIKESSSCISLVSSHLISSNFDPSKKLSIGGSPNVSQNLDGSVNSSVKINSIFRA